MKAPTSCRRSTACLLAAILLLSAPAWGQAIYRSTGPDGRVTFSDKPPTGDARAITLRAEGTGGTPADDSLPAELRQAAQRYPVTLYSGDNCTPCDGGRALLKNRGIPFVERTVTTPQDGEALKRLSGETTLPTLTLGGQRLKGFSDTEWTLFLNAAGYPAQSRLPPNYRWAAPAALVSVQAPTATPTRPAEPRAPVAEQPSTQTLPAVDPVGDNPAGIRF